MKYFWQEYDLINPYRSHTPRGFYDPTRGHTGGDWNIPVGVELSLPEDMTVAQVLVQDQMGNTLYLRDKDGNILVFSHLSAVYVQQGDLVSRGKVFALTGNTGSATTGPHLHFEVISQTPEEKIMTRSLGGFVGYNIEPVKYLNSLSMDEYATEADLALRRLMSEGYITQEKDLQSPVPYGELAIILNRILDAQEESR